MDATELTAQLKSLVMDVPDFPKPGVMFKDITPLLAQGSELRRVVRWMAEQCPGDTTQVVGIEARGFVLGAALAQALGTGFVPLRKPGKLPRAVHRETFELEYGSDALEVHRDALQDTDRVVLVDDVLATGGTAAAAATLLTRMGIALSMALFLMELRFLHGAERCPVPTRSLLVYEA